MRGLRFVSAMAIAGCLVCCSHQAKDPTGIRDSILVRVEADCAHRPELIQALPLYDEVALAALEKTPNQYIIPGPTVIPEHWRISLSHCVGYSVFLGELPTALRIFRLDEFFQNGSAWPIESNDPLFERERAKFGRWIDSGWTSGDQPLASIIFDSGNPDIGVDNRALAFTGGRGRRVLLRYTQESNFVWNLKYEFQGMTDSGEYYVHLAVPLSIPGLANDQPNHLGFERSQLWESEGQLQAYFSAVKQHVIDHLDQIEPSLERLDELMSKVVVEPLG